MKRICAMVAFVAVALLALILVVSCGAGKHPKSAGTGFSAPDANPSAQNSSNSAPASKSLDAALSEIRGYTPPAKVDPAVFEKLRAALVSKLTELTAPGARIPSSAPQGDAGRVTDLSIVNSAPSLYTLHWTYRNLGDYDGNGEVGVADITPIAMSYMANTSDGLGDDKLEAWFDGDGNGEIGVSDITPIAMNFLSSVVGYNICGGSDPSSPFELVAFTDFGSAVSGNPPWNFTYDLSSLDYAYYIVRPTDGISEGQDSTIGIPVLIDPSAAVPVQVNATLPPAVLALGNIMVQSFIDEQPLGSNLNLVPGGDQTVFLKIDGSSDPLIPARVLSADLSAGTVMLDNRSFALALIGFNHLLMTLADEEVGDFWSFVESDNRVDGLGADIGAVLGQNPASALDADVHPELFQQALQIGFDSLDAMAQSHGASSFKEILAFEDSPPYLTTGTGNAVIMNNPKCAFYCAGISSNGGPERLNIVCAKSSVYATQFGWPPVYPAPPTQEVVQLVDGSHTFVFDKGMTLNSLSQGRDQAATAANLTRLGIIAIKAVAHVPLPVTNRQIEIAEEYYMGTGEGGVDFAGIVANLSFSRSVWDIASNILKDPASLVKFRALQALVFGQAFGSEAQTRDFMQSASKVFADAAKILNITAYANDYAPFFYDMIFGPGEVTYNVSVTNGIPTITEGTSPPIASFTFSPSPTTLGGQTSFDGLASFDDKTSTVNLDYAWEFGDGASLPWSGAATTNHTYSSVGTYIVRLTVRDEDELVGIAERIVSVVPVGGALTASIGADQTSGPSPLTISFSGSAIGGTQPYTYQWDFTNDGGWDSAVQNPSHIYNTAGNYTCRLRVTDSASASDEDTQAISATGGGAGRGDWWMFGHDLQHTRRSPFIGPNAPTLKWAFVIGFAVDSSPAIAADGTVYVGSYDGNLYAINPDGTRKWTFTTGNVVSSSPAIGADGTIYVGSSDGNLYAINPDSTSKWEYATGNGVESSPAIGTDGTVYVVSRDDNLYAINPNGTLKWSFPTGTVVQMASPAIDADGTVYVGSHYSNLYAINPDGTQKWVYRPGIYLESSPAIGADGTVYVGSFEGFNGNLCATNPDGTLKWSFTTGSYVTSSPAIGGDGTVYVGSDDGNLYAINPDGTPKWSFTTGSAVRSSPAIGADGTIYVGSYDGNLYATNPDGTPKWSFTTGSAVSSSPAIGADGTIYVGSYDGNLYAIGPGAG